MREKLLSYLNSVFDKDPYKILVLRISHVSGARWRIADRTLYAGNAVNDEVYDIDLREFTILELANRLGYLGYDVIYLNQSYRNLPADILIEGEGIETSHNGDHLYTFSSTLWKILNPIGLMLQETKENAIDKGIKMAYFHSATAFWLEKWASWFGGIRKEGESDADFLTRTIAEVVRIRNTPNALKNAVKALTGIDVFIHELWRDAYSAANPSAADGTWCRFEAIVYHEITEEERAGIIRVIERNRPIGVLFEGINRALQFMLRAQIDYDPYLSSRTEPVDWHVDHDWKDDEGGYYYGWSDTSIFGFRILTSLS